MFNVRIIVSYIFLLMLPVWLSASYDKWVFSTLDAADGLSDNQVRYIVQLNDGRMVFATSGNLNIYNGTGFTYIHRRPQDVYELTGYKGHYRMYLEGDSLIWIKDFNKLMLVDLLTESYVSNFERFFPVDGVRDFFVDADQGRWLLMDDSLMNADTGVSIELKADWGILQDVTSSHDSLYLFFSTGVARCYHAQSGQLIDHSQAYPQTKQSLFERTSLVVRGEGGFYQLRNGIRGGFFFFDTASREWHQLLETNYTLNTMIFTPDKKAMVSSPLGMWVVNREDDTQTFIPRLKTVDGEVLDTEISTIFQDIQGGLWFGTYKRGLLYYHPSRYRFSTIDRSYFPGLATSRDIEVLRFAQKDTYYLYTNMGYYAFESATLNAIDLVKVAGAQLPLEVQRQFNTPIQ